MSRSIGTNKESMICNGIDRAMDCYLFITEQMILNKKSGFDLDMLPTRWYYVQAYKKFRLGEQAIKKKYYEYTRLMNEKHQNKEVYDYIITIKGDNILIAFEQASSHFSINESLIKKKYYFHKGGYYDKTIQASKSFGKKEEEV